MPYGQQTTATLTPTKNVSGQFIHDPKSKNLILVRKMPTSTITSKGQITIPKEVQEALNLRPGDRLDFIIEQGRVYVQPANVDVRLLSGLLHKPERQPVSLEEMEAAIDRGAREAL